MTICPNVHLVLSVAQTAPSSFFFNKDYIMPASRLRPQTAARRPTEDSSNREAGAKVKGDSEVVFLVHDVEKTTARSC